MVTVEGDQQRPMTQLVLPVVEVEVTTPSLIIVLPFDQWIYIVVWPLL